MQTYAGTVDNLVMAARLLVLFLTVYILHVKLTNQISCLHVRLANHKEAHYLL